MAFRATKSSSDTMGRAKMALNTALFQSDFPLPIHIPPQKKNQNVLHETIVYEALISRN